MASVRDLLLKPAKRITYRSAPSLETLATSGRDLFVVGKKEAMCNAVDQLAKSLGQPMLAKQAEAMSGGYKGAKAEVPWLSENDLRKVTLVTLPDAAGRSVTPVRPDVIAKQLHGKTAGADVVLAVGEKDALAAGLAVARALSPYTAKTEEVVEPSVCNVSFHGCSPSDELLEHLNTAAECVRIAQGLVDMPPNMLHPTSFKDFVLDAIKDLPSVTHTILEGEELKDKGYGL
eukprot:CAMPEP_0197701696 /NCGR_PEP_ID=MMETSP1338-20131121/123570_1 /TAXON_ID=43686 ORGANISM="Pelagodinium beii, Strain RCC1491" /NCGR_SAMPLE_ID=MMETSP1338 /ASSEMBLY_ACC=CAM_ASM_000754 /LENGTH=231 /DNA_ID=CAMNT_0043285423 /DNA_START=130 /DNA_END=822 /DNA_ORIENTATION=+